MIKPIDLGFFWLKVICVAPQQHTSIQYHQRRVELLLGFWGIPGIWLVLPHHQHTLFYGIYVEFAFGKVDERDIIRNEDLYDRA